MRVDKSSVQIRSSQSFPACSDLFRRVSNDSVRNTERSYASGPVNFPRLSAGASDCYSPSPADGLMAPSR
jgi:hypothetical protein